MIVKRPMLAGWYFDNRDIEEAVAGERLLNPSLDLGVTCDLNCPYCFTEDVIGRRRSARNYELTVDQTIAVLEDFVDAGARTVNIVGAGEPFLHSAIRAIVEMLARRHVTTVIFTNGTKLAADAELLAFLSAHDVTVVLKYNSRFAKLQDAVAGRSGYTARRDAALERLIRAGYTSSEPTRLGIDTLAFAGNVDELPAIHRWCREINIYPLTSDFIPAGRTKCGGMSGGGLELGVSAELAAIATEALRPLTANQRRELAAALRNVDESLGIERSATTNAYYGGGACTQILGVYVDVEGSIWPCVARQRVIGPIDQPLGYIQNGDKPSTVWRSSSYLRWIRATYSGGCPYKPNCPATGPTHGADDARERTASHAR